MREACALGIPADYGRRHHMRPVLEPATLQPIGHDVFGRPQWLAPRAARAFLRMQRAAAADGIELQVVSAFRSAAYQLGIFERKLARGEAMADILRVSAAPGYSEHHSGRAVDLSCPGYAPLAEDFAASPAHAWLLRHAAGFRFRLSYPRDNPHGIAWEPWHWCWHARRA